MEVTLTVTTLGRKALNRAALTAGFHDARVESRESRNEDAIRWDDDRLHLTPYWVLALCDATVLHDASLNCYILKWRM
jgi:hypothetical protein